MIEAARLLGRLAAKGIRLETDGKTLRYAPRDAMTPSLIAATKRHKADIVRLLDDEDSHREIFQVLA